jgi:uncharacterized phage protein (TIGR01671 family)
MREIKFRAWNVDSKTYLPWQFLDTDSQFELYKCCEYPNGPGPWRLEQYTGLKDKNGQEIYEGDILAGVLGTAGRGAITRKEKPFNFQAVWDRSGWGLSAVSRYENSSYRWYPSFSECEVIGNIYENPELL